MLRISYTRFLLNRNLPSAWTVCEHFVGKFPRIAIGSFNKINSHKSWICVKTHDNDWYVLTSCTNGIKTW